MKSKLVSAVILMLVITMIASLSTVIATDQSNPLDVSNQGVVWTVDMNIILLSGKDADLETIECKAIFEDGSEAIVVPYKVSVADSQIKLWFEFQNDPSLPDYYPYHCVRNTFYVDLFGGGYVHYQSGPGWAYRWY